MTTLKLDQDGHDLMLRWLSLGRIEHLSECPHLDASGIFGRHVRVEDGLPHGVGIGKHFHTAEVEYRAERIRPCKWNCRVNRACDFFSRAQCDGRGKITNVPRSLALASLKHSLQTVHRYGALDGIT